MGFALALGGLLVGLPAGSALAGEPTTPAEARAMAQEYSEQADQQKAMGGVGYASGRVQAAERKATRYEELADQLAAPPAPAPSPEEQRYADLAESYREMGGFAYKTGLVERAETEQRKYETAPAGVPATGKKPLCSTTKPAVQQFDCER